MKALGGLLLSVLLLAGCGGGGGGSSAPAPTLPPGQALRLDLKHAYYGDWTSQFAETQAHVNAAWLWGWPPQPGVDVLTLRLEEAAQHGVPYVIVGLGEASSPQAEAQIRAQLDNWRARGLLGHVYGFTPVDEPDGAGATSGDQLRAWASMLRERVLPDYPELAGAKLAVIYSPRGRPAIEVFDLAGWNDYDAGYSVLGEDLAAFKRLLRPDQGIILVVGGADGVGAIDPEPFFAKAQTDPQVKLVVSFIWFDNWDKEFRGALRGIRSNGMAPAYCRMGKRIKFPGVLDPVCP